jgi:hypothetical protein
MYLETTMDIKKNKPNGPEAISKKVISRNVLHNGKALGVDSLLSNFFG